MDEASIASISRTAIQVVVEPKNIFPGLDGIYNTT